MICGKCAMEFPDGSESCPWCGNAAPGQTGPDRKGRSGAPVRMRVGAHEGTRKEQTAGAQTGSRRQEKWSGASGAAVRKDYRWLIIALASLVCVLTLFMPWITVRSEMLGATTGWEIGGVYEQTERIDSLMESELWQFLTDESKAPAAVLNAIPQVDTEQISKSMVDLKENLLLVCVIIFTMIGVNLLCAVFCLTPLLHVKTIFTLAACFMDIAAALLVRYICRVQAEKMASVADILEWLEKQTVLKGIVGEFTAYTRMQPGIACLTVLVMAFVSGIVLLFIRAGRRTM